jgi:hypothetical protein
MTNSIMTKDGQRKFIIALLGSDKFMQYVTYSMSDNIISFQIHNSNLISIKLQYNTGNIIDVSLVIDNTHLGTYAPDTQTFIRTKLYWLYMFHILVGSIT